MNPLNPWVALTEILVLLLAAFGIGYLIAYGQYRRPIEAKRLRIKELKQMLNGPGQTSPKPEQVEDIVPEPD